MAKQRELKTRKDGVKQHYNTGSSVTSNADARAAFNPRPAKKEEPVPEYDIDELTEKLGQPSNYDPVKAAQLDADLGRYEYVSTSVDVVEEAGRPVIVLNREKLILVADPDGVGVTWASALENAELHRDVDDSESADFDEMRRDVECRAEDSGIDIDDIEVRENATYGYEDGRGYEDSDLDEDGFLIDRGD